MAAAKFKVTYLDGTEKVVRLTPKAMVMFEHKFGKTVSEFRNNVSAEGLYFQAWAGLHCAGMEGKDFDEFLGLLESVEPVEVEDVDVVDPTKRAPGLDPLSV